METAPKTPHIKRNGRYTLVVQSWKHLCDHWPDDWWIALEWVLNRFYFNLISGMQRERNFKCISQLPEISSGIARISCSYRVWHVNRIWLMFSTSRTSFVGEIYCSAVGNHIVCVQMRDAFIREKAINPLRAISCCASHSLPSQLFRWDVLCATMARYTRERWT